MKRKREEDDQEDRVIKKPAVDNDIQILKRFGVLHPDTPHKDNVLLLAVERSIRRDVPRLALWLCPADEEAYWKQRKEDWRLRGHNESISRVLLSMDGVGDTAVQLN